MHLQSVKNKKVNNVLVTSENLFAGLPLDDRLESCIKLIKGRATQFLRETSILLDMARKEASAYVSCEAENETDICAFLAQLDIEVQEIAEQTRKKLMRLSHN